MQKVLEIHQVFRRYWLTGRPARGRENEAKIGVNGAGWGLTG